MSGRSLLASFLSLAAACASRPTAEPTPPPTELDPAAIDAWMQTELEASEIVGAQLAIVRDGQPVLVRNYGHVTLGGAPVTDDTAFAIGSVTKQFVCAAALLLARDGALSLDDPIGKYYPDLTRATEITLDDLGSHLAGYPDFYPLDFVDARMRAPIEPDAILERYAMGALDFEPRTRWSYSNTGFIALGRVVERVSGEGLSAFLQQRVFEPLKMDDASFVPPDDAPGLAQGHGRFALGPVVAVPREAEGWIHAAGGIYASADDLVRWDLALMDGALLDADSMARFTRARTLTDGRSTEYGCGIGVRTMSGETVLTHSGAVSGFLAANAFVPRTRTAVILLSNTETGSFSDLARTLLALAVKVPELVPRVAGPPAQDVARTLFAQLQAGRLDAKLVSEELALYYDEKHRREAAPRLRALGDPLSVRADPPRERGGMEVTSIHFTFAKREIEASMYRAPDGTVHQFLLLL